MIYLYFLLDICFYNYTILKPSLTLLPLLEKENTKFFLLWILLIDYLLNFKFKYFIIFIILYILNKKIKLHYNLFYQIIRFLIIYTIYITLIYFIFKSFHFSFYGLLIDLLFILIDIKVFNKS